MLAVEAAAAMKQAVSFELAKAEKVGSYGLKPASDSVYTHANFFMIASYTY